MNSITRLCSQSSGYMIKIPNWPAKQKYNHIAYWPLNPRNEINCILWMHASESIFVHNCERWIMVYEKIEDNFKLFKCKCCISTLCISISMNEQKMHSCITWKPVEIITSSHFFTINVPNLPLKPKWFVVNKSNWIHE